MQCGPTGAQLLELFVLPNESCTWDFIIEQYRRGPLGGVTPERRALHAAPYVSTYPDCAPVLRGGDAAAPAKAVPQFAQNRALGIFGARQLRQYFLVGYAI